MRRAPFAVIARRDWLGNPMMDTRKQEPQARGGVEACLQGLSLHFDISDGFRRPIAHPAFTKYSIRAHGGSGELKRMHLDLGISLSDSVVPEGERSKGSSSAIST